MHFFRPNTILLLILLGLVYLANIYRDNYFSVFNLLCIASNICGEQVISSHPEFLNIKNMLSSFELKEASIDIIEMKQDPEFYNFLHYYLYPIKINENSNYKITRENLDCYLLKRTNQLKLYVCDF
jgi:hypothetical protein